MTPKNYVSKPPHQETGSNPNTDQKEDETQQHNTGSDTDLKREHYLDRKQAFDDDKEKASSATVNTNQSKKRQKPTKHDPKRTQKKSEGTRMTTTANMERLSTKPFRALSSDSRSHR